MNGSTVFNYKSVGTESPDTAGTVNTRFLQEKLIFNSLGSVQNFFSLFTEIVTQGRISWKDNLAKSVLHLSGIADPHTRQNALHVFDGGTVPHVWNSIWRFSPSSFSLWASIFRQMLTESSHNTASGKSGLSECLEEGAVMKDSKSSCSSIILQAVFTLQTGQAHYNF